MVDVIPVALGVGAFAVALWYGSRTVATRSLYRSLSGDDPYGSTNPIDGEAVTVEGTVTVDESAPSSDSLESLAGCENPIALFDWRVRSPQGKNRYRIDFENRTITRKRTTIESGIAAGEFGVDDGTREYRVDPEWLVETYSDSPLEEAAVSGAQASSPLFDSEWPSPHVHLDEYVIDCPLDRAGELFDDASNPQRDRYRFGARAVPDGETLAVHGAVDIEDGVPVIRGSEEEELAVSDRGIDGLTTGVRNRFLKYGAFATGSLAVAVYLVYAGIWSPPL